MKVRVTTIVRCADLVRHMYATLASVERQHGGYGEVVIVTDPSTPQAARAWLDRLAADRGFLVANAASVSAGAARNAGVRIAGSSYVACLDAGDTLNAMFHESLADRLDADPTIDVVTSAIQLLGPGARSRVATPEDTSLSTLLGNTDAIHEASMFRRAAWEALNGFDETLPALDAYEFWLRLLQSGRRADIVDRPLLIRPLREDALYRRAWEPQHHLAALKMILEKHAALFASDPAAALFGRETRIQALAQTYRDAVARRDDGVKKREALRARATFLRYSVPASEQQTVDLGDLQRTSPVARDWGYERGTPVDRHYIERFLERSAPDIRGAVLEIQEPDYTQRFGGPRVTRSDVLDLDSTNPRATVISDLRRASNVPSDTYDCIILTQTVHVIDDMHAALSECARILKPGGVLLATLPSASRVCLEYGHDGDFWRVTEAGARHLFGGIFPVDALEIQAYGNVLVNAAFLYGLSCQELNESDFEAVDPYFPLLVSVRAQKPGGSVLAAVTTRQSVPGAAVLLYHRISAAQSDVHGLCVTPEDFRAQMAHVRESYCPMPLGALVAAARENRVPPGSVAVTFDDGYVDNYTNASPILTEYGIPATFFVTTDRLDEGIEYWWDVLEQALLSPTLPTAAELQIDLPTGRRVFPTLTSDERGAAHGEIYAAIAGSSTEVRDAVIADVIRWAGSRGGLDPERRRMTSTELLAMAARPGHDIGAHSVRHLMLTLQPPMVQRHEVAASRSALESLLGRPVLGFAYPYGAHNPDVVDEVRGASFDLAVTCEEALVAADTDPLRVPRLEVTPQRSATFDAWLARQWGQTPSKK